MGFSFEQVNATDYDELRPTYAPESVRWVAERARLGPGAVVVDLAAGTGQLSRRLASLGLRVIAVEPQFPRNTSARVIRDELRSAQPPIDAEFAEVDPLETCNPDELSADLYERKMRENLLNLTKVLR